MTNPIGGEAEPSGELTIISGQFYSNARRVLDQFGGTYGAYKASGERLGSTVARSVIPLAPDTKLNFDRHIPVDINPAGKDSTITEPSLVMYTAELRVPKLGILNSLAVSLLIPVNTNFKGGFLLVNEFQTVNGDGDRVVSLDEDTEYTNGPVENADVGGITWDTATSLNGEGWLPL